MYVVEIRSTDAGTGDRDSRYRWDDFAGADVS